MNSKRMVISLMLALFALAAVTANAFASFDEIYMVDSSGSTTSKGTFGWDETPWLYLNLPSAGWNVTGSWWKDPDALYYFTGSSPSTDLEQWLTLSDWASVRKIGDWNVNAAYFYSDGAFGTGSTKFAVVPEPISTILFLSGGALMGGRLLIRRRRK